MSRELYACLHAPQFPLQSLLRLRPEQRGDAVAVLDGRPPLETVCSINRAARLKGAALDMTRVEAEAIPGLRLLSRSPECESAAREVLLECAANYSPRIEETRGEAYCACVLERFGDGTAVWASRCACSENPRRACWCGLSHIGSREHELSHGAAQGSRFERGGCHSRRTGSGCAGASAARCAQPAGEGSGDTCDMGRPLSWRISHASRS